MAADPTEPPPRPEDLTEFRLGRLLLLLEEIERAGRKHLDIERLGIYEFFAAQPLLVFENESPERRELVLAGFDSRSLSYQSASARFTNRRARLQHDLSFLIAHDLADVANEEGKIVYLLTEQGRETAGSFTAFYAETFRVGARLVSKRFNSLTDQRLRRDADQWLRAESLLIDLYEA
jgi:hypothetical protein